MAKNQIRVTPSLITWAREMAGYSTSEAKKYFKKIDQWESGELFPTYLQLEKLSKQFKVPVAVFFFPDPPDVPTIDEYFRTLSPEYMEHMPPKIRLLLRKAKVMQINLSELNDGVNPASKFLTKDFGFDQNDNAESIAQRLRAYLHVPIGEQFSWKSIEDALENWRQVLSDHGIYVFKDAFMEKGYYGFCLYDEEFPIIYVNNSSAKSRQIFTIFHELAHLIFRTSGIDVINDDHIDALPENSRKIEIFCNRFASKFLVPDDSFSEISIRRPANRETAQCLAKKFHVSREVIYGKFLDREEITEVEYQQATEQWRGNEKTKNSSGGDYYSNHMAYLGRRYISLTFERFYQNRFDAIQLADYLNMKPRNVASLEEKYLREFTIG